MAWSALTMRVSVSVWGFFCRDIFISSYYVSAIFIQNSRSVECTEKLLSFERNFGLYRHFRRVIAEHLWKMFNLLSKRKIDSYLCIAHHSIGAKRIPTFLKLKSVGIFFVPTWHKYMLEYCNRHRPVAAGPCLEFMQSKQKTTKTIDFQAQQFSD